MYQLEYFIKVGLDSNKPIIPMYILNSVNNIKKNYITVAVAYE